MCFLNVGKSCLVNLEERFFFFFLCKLLLDKLGLVSNFYCCSITADKL